MTIMSGPEADILVGNALPLDKIPPGRNVPWEVNVIIEVPLGGAPVKYELDKESGAMYYQEGFGVHMPFGFMGFGMLLFVLFVLMIGFGLGYVVGRKR